MGALTGPVGHSKAHAQNMLADLQKATTDAQKKGVSSQDAENMPVRFKAGSGKTASGRDVKVMVGMAVHKGHSGDGVNKTLQEQAHATSYLQSISTDHGAKTVDPTQIAPSAKSISQRSVQAVNPAKIELTSGQTVDVMTVGQAKAILQRDLMLFSLDEVSANPTPQAIQNHISDYIHAGAGGQKMFLQHAMSLSGPDLSAMMRAQSANPEFVNFFTETMQSQFAAADAVQQHPNHTILQRELAVYNLSQMPDPPMSFDIQNHMQDYQALGSAGQKLFLTHTMKLGGDDRLMFLRTMADEPGFREFVAESLSADGVQPKTGQGVNERKELYRFAGAAGLKQLEADTYQLSRTERRQVTLALGGDSQLSQPVLSAWGQAKAESHLQTAGQPRTLQDRTQLLENFKTDLQNSKGANQRPLYSDRMVDIAVRKMELATLPALANIAMEGSWLTESMYGNTGITADQEQMAAVKHLSGLSTSTLSALEAHMDAEGIGRESMVFTAIQKARQLAMNREMGVMMTRLDRALLDGFNQVPEDTKISYPKGSAPSETVAAFKELPKGRPQGENLTTKPEFKAIAHPRLANINTYAGTAVRVNGTACYPGSEITMPGGDRYLAMQGAGENNRDKFWQVLQEYGASVSVSLTDVGESRYKLAEHVPPEGETARYGSVEVEHVKSVQVADGKFEVQQLLVNGEPHTRVWYRKWPDKTGGNAADIAALHYIVQSLRPDPASPVAVNCNAGVGRTATTIVGMEVLKAQERNEVNATALSMIAAMRDQRDPQAIQTADQLFTVNTLEANKANLARNFSGVVTIGAN